MSLTTEKPKAIIYCAENLLSGKKYIGRTTRSLNIRKTEHFTKTIKCKHRFATALKCYPKDSWNFYVLKEVAYEKADYYEMFFIADLDTCNPEKGYNTLKEPYIGDGASNINFNPEICYLYHFKYGDICGTRSDLAKKYPELKNIYKLLSRERNQLRGWVLAENKCSYEIFINESKKRRKREGKICNPITLNHNNYGTHTLTYKEFINQFGLTNSGLCKLVSGKYKNHQGWTLVKEVEKNANTKGIVTS